MDVGTLAVGREDGGPVVYRRVSSCGAALWAGAAQGAVGVAYLAVGRRV